MISRLEEAAAAQPALLKAINYIAATLGIGSFLGLVQRYTAQVGYSRAITWERGSATMQAMAALLELAEGDLDELFAYAAEVRV